jgi:hypothetical protein
MLTTVHTAHTRFRVELYFRTAKFHWLLEMFCMQPYPSLSTTVAALRFINCTFEVVNQSASAKLRLVSAFQVLDLYKKKMIVPRCISLFLELVRPS